MCGRYGLSTPSSQIIEQIQYLEENKEIFKKYYQGKDYSPGDKILIIKNNINHFVEKPVLWGIKPYWNKSLLINARKENLFSSPFWKPLVLENRCLIPASYFIEWQMDRGRKKPWKISLKNTELFCFAGIYLEPKETNLNQRESVVILTEPANSLMQSIHNHGPNKHRQPVIIHPKKYKEWLEPTLKEEHIESILKTYPSEILQLEAINSDSQADLF